MNLSLGQGYSFFYEQLNEELSLRMIRVPGGKFVMGSPNSESARLSSEGPQHELSVKTFYICKYPITQAQWHFVTTLSEVSRVLQANTSSFKGTRRPVEQVSWYDAVEFCARLSRYTQRQYYLPSEAQWEYACRAGTSTPFHFGETITTDLSNYRGIENKVMGWSGFYGKGPEGECREETTPVDYFGLTNAFGLCDMHGNVWEWCLDHWHDNYEGAPMDESAWLTSVDSMKRVARGGSWVNDPKDCRSSTRFHAHADSRYDNIGFRVCCIEKVQK